MKSMRNRRISGSEALFEAHQQSLKKFKNLFLMGEGINDPGGIFGTTTNLFKKFGSSRVIELPISENANTGIAIGLCLMGNRVLITHQRVDFALLSIEQIFNTAAKTFFVTNKSHTVPLVIRMIIGRGWGQGPQHSQSLESIFSSIPGLKVIAPSFPSDMKGLLNASIADNNPVIFLEHRWSHFAQGNVKKEYYKDTFKSKIVKKGKDITVVCYSYNVIEVLETQKYLSKLNIELEIIDLRILRPIDYNPIIKSLKKTGRLIVLDIGHKILGLGSEIVSHISELHFDCLTTSPLRLGLPGYPTPSSRYLVRDYYINHLSIFKSCIKSMNFKMTNQIKNIEIEIKKYYNSIEFDKPHKHFKGPF